MDRFISHGRLIYEGVSSPINPASRQPIYIQLHHQKGWSICHEKQWSVYREKRWSHYAESPLSLLKPKNGVKNGHFLDVFVRTFLGKGK